MTTDKQKTCRGCEKLILKLSDHKDDCPYKEIFPDMFASVEESSEGGCPFRLDDTVTIPALKVQIFIRTEHHPESSLGEHYETFAFSRGGKKHWAFRRNYTEEEDARKGHQELIEKVTTGKWELVPVQWKIRYVSDGREEGGNHQEDSEESLFSEIVGDLEKVYAALPQSLHKMLINMTIQRVKELKEMRSK